MSQNKIPKISYLIALFNKKEFIIECIQSILNDGSDDYILEVCIVDDGSIDGSLAEVEAFYENNNVIKVAKFEKNKGKVAAYNKAFSICTGDFISIMGADDVVIRGRTKILLDSCVSSGGAVYGGLLKYKTNTPPESGIPYYPPQNPSYLNNIIGNKLSGGCFMAPFSVIKEIFPIPENLKFEDWWIANKLLKLKKVTVVKNFVTYYRIHDGNDCGAERITADALKKDYERHFSYLDIMRKEAATNAESLYIERAYAIRRLVCGRRVPLRSLIMRPYNKSYILLIVLFLFGPKIYDLKSRKIWRS